MSAKCRHFTLKSAAFNLLSTAEAGEPHAHVPYQYTISSTQTGAPRTVPLDPHRAATIINSDTMPPCKLMPCC
ncbi:hypothetical protein FIBSPDRAFT_850479, partial [Athelia psychrophila]